jgi:ubiquinone/menaquinone biosynthesis C-methylase UbiE
VGEDVEDRYYVSLGAAFARGRLSDLAGLDDASAFGAGRARGLKMHKFKRNAELPRVRRVVSMLAGLAPDSLLDVGSGQGVFLWPLLDAFPDLRVTAIDVDEQRAADLAAVARGGVERLASARMDAASLGFADGSFDAATMLEVLEHMPRPELAAREAVRVARRFVIATVPSKPDDNPEHVRLYDRASLSRLFEQAGARSVRVEFVLNHIVALALVGPG